MGSLRLFKDFLTRFHRRRAFFASRFNEEMLRRFAVFWAKRSTTFLRERGSSLIYCLASSFNGIQCRCPSTTRLIMQTLLAMFFPFLHPRRNGIPVNIIYLGNGFDRYALAAQQKTMGTHTSSM